MRSVDIAPRDLDTLRRILRSHLPEYEIRAFGSRVHGENLKPFSDLDLAVITDHPLAPLRLAEVRDALVDSDLPFKVDLLDWAATSEAFRKIVEKEYVVIQRGRDDNRFSA